VIQGEVRVDLPYAEDSVADVDLNVVMTEDGKLIEVQGTAEREPFPRSALDLMLDAAARGIAELNQLQRRAVS